MRIAGKTDCNPVVLVVGILAACGSQPQYDVIVGNGTIYDGIGDSPFVGDLAINGDAIAAICRLGRTRGEEPAVLAVAPGFINMMCWANESLIEDSRSKSDMRQGVTLEILGEGFTRKVQAEIWEAWVRTSPERHS